MDRWFQINFCQLTIVLFLLFYSDIKVNTIMIRMLFNNYIYYYYCLFIYYYYYYYYFFFFFFFFFFYCSTKYTAYMNQIIYIHTISIQRIKDIIIMVSYNYVYTSIITISVTCINEKSIYR